ncbi:MAG: YggS family pyridoxal phosphate-dependent enzyme [Acidobacteria bacterium]|nr:MAG: YggS family pyridoxal phosphate-dependent enzyme [Acidobacteriota bacterium]REK03971.1 MAG: YggS family pyridoxal phosphate-dependent enzyme [Acidobacteriota bacterium]REK15133.1 MAG: YggS family pyridoxal phosphate-dependent enzyme [Acidobacteriota bacterium]REK46223.1 MAG: YggS family pyridoxal phosphate-dependent enzyme [Acidobacteriota bacterium]
MVEGFSQRIAHVQERIEAACDRSGRDPAEVKLVAVSKTHSVDTVREAISSGILVFGENKVQEGIDKIENISNENCEWHLIGHLQSNKARKAITSFDVIQTVDSAKLANRLNRIAGDEGRYGFPVLLQVDLGKEKTKSGVYEEDLRKLVDEVLECSNLSLGGLMTIPPYLPDPDEVRPFFRRLRELRDQLANEGVFGEGRGELSMGMSHDFEAAIEEGATIVRVGTAIFGPRQ